MSLAVNLVVKFIAELYQQESLCRLVAILVIAVILVRYEVR
jgi:hypothetical protein